MATLIVGDGLRDLIQKKVIENGVDKCVEGMKYDFRLGDRFLKAKHKVPANISDFTVASKENFVIEPGETVFVVSEEILHLPSNIKAEISHKRRIAHYGILVLGGFCIDPLYEGRLIFGMYNYSSEPFYLKREAKLIAAQFYLLSEGEITNFPKPESLMDFPDDLLQIAKGLRPISLGGINEKINKLTDRLLNMENSFNEQKNWFKESQNKIDQLINVTTELRSSLDEERILRKTGQGSLEKLILQEQGVNQEISKTLTTLSQSATTEKLIRKIAVWAIAAILAGGFSVGFAILLKNLAK